MNYSFTQPNQKNLLKALASSWWSYIFLTFFALAVFIFLLYFQNSLMQSQTKQIISKQSILLESSIKKSIAEQNIALSESIEKLLNLIPDQITLNEIYLEEYQLTLQGSTPSKQIYTFLLEVPLRSIFPESKVVFHTLPNGQYNFTSISQFNPKDSR